MQHMITFAEGHAERMLEIEVRCGASSVLVPWLPGETANEVAARVVASINSVAGGGVARLIGPRTIASGATPFETSTRRARRRY